MQLRRPHRFLSCLLVVAGCASPINPTYDADPEADFPRYQTYAWISAEPILGPSSGVAPARYVSPIDEQGIRRAVDAELMSRGYRAAAWDAADLVVSFAVGSQEKIRVEEVPGRTTAYRRGYGYGSGYASSPTRMRTYTQGTLTLGFFDRASKQAVGGAGPRRPSPSETIATTRSVAPWRRFSSRSRSAEKGKTVNRGKSPARTREISAPARF